MNSGAVVGGGVRVGEECCDMSKKDVDVLAEITEEKVAKVLQERTSKPGFLDLANMKFPKSYMDKVARIMENPNLSEEEQLALIVQLSKPGVDPEFDKGVVEP